jgi:hypothetical protein
LIDDAGAAVVAVAIVALLCSFPSFIAIIRTRNRRI